ncbi:MAG TPA: hypothetical protein VHX88_04105 [Solirubrobacteraceae bacterium]|nr:hypothetical protein [Solirubrobacteraceae bacterium]
MITPADEWHVHQTPEPIAVAGTDRNFYDRSYFGGYTADGSLLFAAAFGIYPHLNVADAHFTVVRGDVQECLHASKILHSDRSVLEVGPISIGIEVPLRTLRLKVLAHDGLAADLVFSGRHFPIEEPRFMHRFGPRAFMDYTRMTQGARVSGWIALDGERLELGDQGLGVRDRSWGVRPVGARDPQPLAPARPPQFFWLWTPTHLPGRCAFWHLNADEHGRAWNTAAVLCPDGAGADGLIHGHGEMLLDLDAGSRWPDSGTLSVTPSEGAAPYELRYEPITRLQMLGIGYSHPTWSHGVLRGELDVERETFRLSEVDEASPTQLHRQVLCRVQCSSGGAVEQGVGFLEHLLLGASAPYGLS